MPSPHATTAAADALRAAFCDRDFALVTPHVADDVVFHSPVLAAPWLGKSVLSRLGPSMVSVFDEIEFGPTAVDGTRAILSFRGTVGGVPAEAIETLDLGPDGRIATLAIYIRPLPALIAVAKAMEARVDPALLAEKGR